MMDTLTLAASPAFTNTQYNSSAQFLANSATPGLWYNSQQAGAYSTDALTTGILVPSTATVHQSNGIASYVLSQRAQPGNGGDVAAYFQIGSAANNCAAFALNTVAYDTAGKTGQILGIEIDYNVNAVDTMVNGINLVLNGNVAATNFLNGMAVRTVFGTTRWTNGYIVADGAVSAYAFLAGATGSGSGVDSQSIGLISRTTGGTQLVATILGDRNGGLVLRPGTLGGAVAVQATNGSSNYVVMDSNGVHATLAWLIPTTFAALPAPSAGTQGIIAYITDASAAITAWNQTVTAGGGTTKTFVKCDGTAWKAF